MGVVVVGISNALKQILNEYPKNADLAFKGNALADFIRKDVVSSFQDIANEFDRELIVKASPGKGQWAAVPWIAILDPAIARSTVEGYYVVYLFSDDIVYLCLAQGVTKVYEEFGSHVYSELRRRADQIYEKISGHAASFSPGPIMLEKEAPLAKRYEQSVIVSKSYHSSEFVSEDRIIADLLSACKMYQFAKEAGGHKSAEIVFDEPEMPRDITVKEAKKIRDHILYERNPSISERVKKLHGYNCQVCGFNFEEIYGSHGAGYIEAHHLLPFSALKPGYSRKLDLQNDFAVVCANCHRMLHRTKNVMTIDSLKARIKNRP